MNQIVHSFTAADPKPGAARRFGLFRIGPALLCLDVGCIMEVIATPLQLAHPGMAVAGLIGLLELRVNIIPVMDLRHSLDLPPLSEPGKVVLLVRVDGKLIGLFADAVCGIAAPDDDGLREFQFSRPSMGSVIATHTFKWDGEVVSVLNAELILSLSGVPSL